MQAFSCLVRILLCNPHDKVELKGLPFSGTVVIACRPRREDHVPLPSICHHWLIYTTVHGPCVRSVGTGERKRRV